MLGLGALAADILRHMTDCPLDFNRPFEDEHFVCSPINDNFLPLAVPVPIFAEQQLSERKSP